LSDETYVCTCKPLHRLVGMPGSPSVNSGRAILQLIILITHAGEGYPALQTLQRLQRVTGCRSDYVGVTVGVPQIAADLVAMPKSAGLGQKLSFLVLRRHAIWHLF
jgi:hypothetical protein